MFGRIWTGGRAAAWTAGYLKDAVAMKVKLEEFLVGWLVTVKVQSSLMTDNNCHGCLIPVTHLP